MSEKYSQSKNGQSNKNKGNSSSFYKNKKKRKKGNWNKNFKKNRPNKEPFDPASFISDKKLQADRNSEHLECCLCHKEIFEMTTAVDMVDYNAPAHFECVIDRLNNTENLKDGEKIIYLGNRKFGVVKYNKNNGFNIIREVFYEDANGFKDWRNSFSVEMRKKI